MQVYKRNYIILRSKRCISINVYKTLLIITLISLSGCASFFALNRLDISSQDKDQIASILEKERLFKLKTIKRLGINIVKVESMDGDESNGVRQVITLFKEGNVWLIKENTVSFFCQ